MSTRDDGKNKIYCKRTGKQICSERRERERERVAQKKKHSAILTFANMYGVKSWEMRLIVVLVHYSDDQSTSAGQHGIAIVCGLDD